MAYSIVVKKKAASREYFVDAGKLLTLSEKRFSLTEVKAVLNAMTI